MNQTEMQLNKKYSLPAVQNAEIKMISHSTSRWKSFAQKRNGVPPSSYTVNWPKPTKNILWLEFWNFCTSCPSLLHYAFAATKNSNTTLLFQRFQNPASICPPGSARIPTPSRTLPIKALLRTACLTLVLVFTNRKTSLKKSQKVQWKAHTASIYW